MLYLATVLCLNNRMGKSNMKVLQKHTSIEIHPYAKIMPSMTIDELAELSSDIKRMGQIEPGVIYQGMILDGSNRYVITQELGIDFQYIEFQGDDKAALDYVISKNVIRRHLTAGQKSTISADITNLKRGQRSDHESDNLIKLSESESKTSKLKLVSIEQAAKLMDVSKDSIVKARKLKQDSPELFEEVKSGKISLNKAVTTLYSKPTNKSVFGQRSNISGPPQTEGEPPLRTLERIKQGYLLEIKIAGDRITEAFEVLSKNPELQIPSYFRDSLKLLEERLSKSIENLAKTRKTSAEVVNLNKEK